MILSSGGGWGGGDDFAHSPSRLLRHKGKQRAQNLATNGALHARMGGLAGRLCAAIAAMIKSSAGAQ